MSTIQISFIALTIAFYGFTAFCLMKESFWGSFGRILKLRWGQQVVADLYMGIFIFSFFVYLHEGELLQTLLWVVPTLLLGNLVPLIYVILNFESLMALFSVVS